ncbi:MAG: prephenate dehydrogenase/arogenate dehydrogenase family protein [Acidimicrobiia bacterium]|nr:prephenate dehydrogenase/arogenate dehydrogenase family protein [Acidimicrobiia bacterium]
MRAVILGTGLIGTSIGLGLRGAGWTTAGWDPDGDVLARARERGALDQRLASGALPSAAEADVVILSGPPSSVIDTAAGLETDALVMDVAGVKEPVVNAAGGARFVGTHPMAGRETSGPEAASPALFRGAAWVVVTDGATETDLGTVESLVAALGARSIRMTAAEHDVAVAAISHLPQVLAGALLIEAAAETQALDLAAGSFRDLTRVAASDPGVWAQLLEINRGPLRAAIDGVMGRLVALAEALDSGDDDAVTEFLAEARRLRRSLAPTVSPVRVALADRPGELARVGHALEATSVDVRDLQLRHAPHGGGGVLTLVVRPGEAEPLRHALEAEGLVVVE